MPIITPEGWIVVQIDDRISSWVSSLTREMNAIFKPDTDLRWVGFIAEYYFHAWLERNAIPHEWSFELEETRKRPYDFIIAGRTIDIKVNNRTVPMKPHYGCAVNAIQVDRSDPPDMYFMCSHNRTDNNLWLLGGISHKLLKQGKYCGGGSLVDGNVWVNNSKYALYQVHASNLVPAVTLIEKIKAAV